jgi:hypothetical protein
MGHELVDVLKLDTEISSNAARAVRVRPEPEGQHLRDPSMVPDPPIPEELTFSTVSV